MDLFKQRETPTQNIAYMGVMAAINVIFVLLATYVPYLLFILVFVLPLCSTIVILLCKKIYFPIYAVATIGICLLVTINNICDTLFFVIPSILNGFIFGLLIKKKAPTIWTILLPSFITLGFTYLSIPIIQGIYQQNFLDVFISLFKLDGFIYKDYIIPAFIFILALIQSTISYFVTSLTLPKLGFEFNKNTPFYSIYFFSLLTIILGVIFLFTYPPLTLLITLVLLFITTFIVGDIFVNLNRLGIVISVISLFITIIVLALSYQYIPKPFGFLLINIFFIIEIIYGFTNNYLNKKKESLK